MLFVIPFLRPCHWKPFDQNVCVDHAILVVFFAKRKIMITYKSDLVLFFMFSFFLMFMEEGSHLRFIFTLQLIIIANISFPLSRDFKNSFRLISYPGRSLWGGFVDNNLTRRIDPHEAEGSGFSKL